MHTHGNYSSHCLHVAMLVIVKLSSFDRHRAHHPRSYYRRNSHFMIVYSTAETEMDKHTNYKNRSVLIGLLVVYSSIGGTD
jgi:hypothetical protein